MVKSIIPSENSLPEKLLLLILLAVLFISGCDGGGGSNINVNYEQVYSGTEGIVVSFINNAPQDRLYADSDFKIGLEIANKGAEDTDVHVYIGLEKDYMNLERSMPFTIKNLEGKDAYNLEGNSVYEFLDAKTSKPVSMGESHNALISATYCYDYTTQAKMDVCIDTDVHGSMQEKVCTEGSK